MNLEKFLGSSKKLHLFIVLLVVLIVFLIFSNTSNLLLWDSCAYLGNARSHISTAYYTEDFRYPLLEYLISGIWTFTGESIAAARGLAILISLATVYVWHLIFSKFLANKAIFATIAFALNPLFLFWGFRIYPEMLALLLTSASFYLILKNKRNLILLAGLASGLSFLARFTYAIFPFSAAVYFMTKRKHKDLIVFCAGFALALLPWIAHNMIIHNNPLWDFLSYWRITSTYNLMQPLLIQAQNSLRVLGVLTVFFPFAIFSLLKHKIRPNILLLVYTLLNIFFYFGIVRLKLARYLISLLPFVILICMLWFFLWLKNTNSKPMKLFLIFLVVVSTGVGFGKAAYEISSQGACSDQGAIRKSIDYLRSHTLPGDHVLSNIWPIYGHYNNLNSSGLWSQDINLLIEVHNPKYIVLSSPYGEFNGKFIRDDWFETLESVTLETHYSDKCNNSVDIYRVVS